MLGFIAASWKTSPWRNIYRSDISARIIHTGLSFLRIFERIIVQTEVISTCESFPWNFPVIVPFSGSEDTVHIHDSRFL